MIALSNASSSVPVLIIMTMLLGAGDLVADEPQTVPVEEDIDRCETKPLAWWCQFDREGFLGVGWIRDDDRLQGFELGYGIRVNGDESPGWGTIWLSRQSHEAARSTGLRGEMVLWPFARFWGGLGPLFAAGVEKRQETSHSGYGGYLGLGVQFTMWTTDHWQLATGAEYDVGISSESRSQVHFVVAFAHRRLTIGSIRD